MFFSKFLSFADVFAVVSYDKEEDGYRLVIIKSMNDYEKMFNGLVNLFRLQMYSAESVPLFGPALPNLGVFKDHIGFRELLLAKCECMCCKSVIDLLANCVAWFNLIVMNGEKAAYGTPIFKDKRERTLDLLIRNLEKDYDAMMVTYLQKWCESLLIIRMSSHAGS